LVITDHVASTLICQNPGQISDRHCDEWWVVLEGEIDWIIEGREDQLVKVKDGNFVFVPARTFHRIFPQGGQAVCAFGLLICPDTRNIYTRNRRGR